MKVISVFLTVFLFLTGLAQESTTVTFQEDPSNFANPERGYYSHTEVHSSTYNSLSTESLKSLRIDESITQILRVFYLEDFRTRPINEDYLNNMRQDFAAVRAAGIKAIIRFAYSQGTTAPYNDATPEMVLAHIGQLTPILRENADVIATMQAGFVGTWGEWYYTDHFAQAPGNISDEDWINRKKVVTGLLNALPANRTVQIRTPGYKMTMYDTEPISSEMAFSGSDISRVGHHNDCFVASSTDVGTYSNAEVEKPYLEAETTFLSIGGETCAVAPPYSDCENATSELERFHWSYLNIDYNQDVLNEWDNQGCLDEVTLRLGYRHRLLSATMNQKAKPLGEFQLSFTLTNDGYANFYNPRKLYVKLRNNDSGDEYQLETDIDVRRWPIGEEHNISVAAGVPQEIPNGIYSVFISLPDEYSHLSDKPEYAARFANLNVWNAELGYNDLNLDLAVSSENTELTTYEGTTFFQSENTEEIVELDGSNQIFSSGDDDAIIVYWPLQDETTDRILERSIGEGEFTSYITLNGKSGYYIDSNISEGQEYSYRYKLVNDLGQNTSYSQTTNSQTDANQGNIVIDGNGEDWGGKAPSLSSFGSDFKVIKSFFGSASAIFQMENVTDYAVYLDADKDETTGISTQELIGMDYKIENGSLYEVVNNEWLALGEVNSTSDEVTEVEISYSSIPLLRNDNSVIGISLLADGDFLENRDGNVANHYRILPPDLPIITSIENDPLNETALVVTWEVCLFCDGYIIERSESNSDSFVEVHEFDKDATKVRDRGLIPSNTYFYRIKSYNDLGESVYSEIHMKTLEKILGIEDHELSIYPNPASDVIHFSDFISKVTIFSISGEKMIEKENVAEISIELLNPGIHIIQIQSHGKMKTGKFLKSH